MRRHRLAFGDAPNYRDALDLGGELAFRVSGETPCLDRRHGGAAAARRARQQLPQVQGIHASRRRAGGGARLAARAARTSTSRPIRFRSTEVESAASIVKRFSTGAMSFGSISWEAHTTLGDRDEPPRRPIEYRRGRRGPAALQAAAQRRFDALGDQAGRLGPVRREHRISRQCRATCRSRWRRAPSPARAGSSRATRSTTGSRARAIRCRASA